MKCINIITDKILLLSVKKAYRVHIVIVDTIERRHALS